MINRLFSLLIILSSFVGQLSAHQVASNIEYADRNDVIKVALLLPFLDTQNNQHLRLQEYYEGFLMAVDRLKKDGLNTEVYVFEIGTIAKLESLLGTMEMQELDLVIGGMTDEQISILSDFSRINDIKYVIPFSSRNNEVLENSNIFQVNTPNMHLYSKASSVFVNQFRDKNIVIVDVLNHKDKDDFITTLKSDLRRSNINYSNVTLSDNLSTDILPLLRSDIENIIVPTTGNSNSLKDIMHSLSLVLYENESENITTRLFGYPEWQTFDYNVTKLMHTFGAYFYSSFYVDNQDWATRQFTQDFKDWYGRDLIETFPKYGMFGYDTGLFFLSSMHKYGVNLDNIDSIKLDSTLQFAFKFERANDWGGYINNGLFLIHYDNDNKVYKIDKSQ